MTRPPRDAPLPGHDAFLDIVANLVGVLIILVAVLGSQSTEAVQAALEAAGLVDPDAADYTALADAEMAAASATVDSMRREEMIARYDDKLAAVESLRDRLLDLTNLAQQTWDEESQNTDAANLALAKKQTELAAARSQLQDLIVAGQTLDTDRPTVAVEHLPAPMAQTVTRREIHFRLQRGRIAAVPIERFVEEIKSSMGRYTGAARGPLVGDTIGPLDGFIARFALARRRTGNQLIIGLAGMAIEPIDDDVGRPLDEAIRPGGLVDIELAGRDPDRTSVAIWVYPDSYGEFRRVKEHLYAKGYATAAWPLETGDAITAGPTGRKSSAQ